MVRVLGGWVSRTGVNVKMICGKKCEVFSRITGYLRPVNRWNEGKKEEFKLRKTFDKSFNKEI